MGFAVEGVAPTSSGGEAATRDGAAAMAEGREGGGAATKADDGKGAGWWADIMSDVVDARSAEHSGKVVILLAFLEHLATKGDKLLVFTQAITIIGHNYNRP